MIIHSTKNSEGTRTLPDNKVVCMIRMGSKAKSVLIDLNSALVDCNLIVHTVQELSNCKTAQNVANIPAPGDIGLVGFEGLAIFIPGPVLRSTILTSNTTDPFKLILLITATTRTFDLENNNIEGMRVNAITCTDNLNAWFYGVCLGRITETRFSVVPDDREIILFNNTRHQFCITREHEALGHNPAANQEIGIKEHMNLIDNASILQQLTTAISAQNEEAAKSNNHWCNEILRQVSQDESKKDRTKKIYPSIIKMVCQAAAMSSNDDNKTLPGTYSRFIHQENVGMAQYNLVHQFKEQGSPDVAFASGTTQAL
jgi:hypothetical protein